MPGKRECLAVETARRVRCGCNGTCVRAPPRMAQAESRVSDLKTAALRAIVGLRSIDHDFDSCVDALVWIRQICSDCLPETSGSRAGVPLSAGRKDRENPPGGFAFLHPVDKHCRDQIVARQGKVFEPPRTLGGSPALMAQRYRWFHAQ
jgi:hypothetical protein